ncbi:MAG: hypothetical protein P8184_21070 [Calditrichia bacterium]
MKKCYLFLAVMLLILCATPCSTLFAQQGSETIYQGITIAPTYAYHLSGRTDRVKGYLVKIDNVKSLAAPGLVILASGVSNGEGYAVVNGEKYDVPGLAGSLTTSIDKSGKNVPGKEGWYSYSSGDDIIGEMIIPLKPENLRDGLNEVTFFMNPGGDGFEIIDTRIQSVEVTAPTLVGQTYHLLARGKPSSIRDFDFVFNHTSEGMRLEKDIPDWARRGKVNFYRAGIDWEHLDRMFEMFKEAHINLVATHVPVDENSEEYAQAKAFIDRCHKAGIHVTAFNSLGNVSFRDYLMHPELEKWISRDEYGTLRWRGEQGSSYAADLQNEDYRKNDLLKRAEAEIDAGVDELYYDWAIGGTGDVLTFFNEVRELAKQKGRNVTIYGNCKGNIIADEACDLTKSEGTTEAGIWDGKWVHNIAQARFYYASGSGVKPYRSKYEGADPGVPNPGAYDVRDGMKVGWMKPIAEAAAFQSHFAIAEIGQKLLSGWVNKDNPLAMEVWNGICKYYTFLDQNRDLYTDVSCVSKIGIVAPPHIPSFEVSLTRESLYNALAEMNIMYDVLLLHRLTPEMLAPYKAIIIPNIPWMEEKQLKAIKAYKEKGGKIYTIGSTPELQQLADDTSPADIFAGLKDDGARQELRTKLVNLEGNPLLSLSNARYVAANIVHKNGSDRYILHIVNYDKPLHNVRVRVNMEGYPVKIRKGKIALFSPDAVPLKLQEVSVKGNTVEFVLPQLDIYDVVVLN